MGKPPHCMSHRLHHSHCVPLWNGHRRNPRPPQASDPLFRNQLALFSENQLLPARDSRPLTSYSGPLALQPGRTHEPRTSCNLGCQCHPMNPGLHCCNPPIPPIPPYLPKCLSSSVNQTSVAHEIATKQLCPSREQRDPRAGLARTHPCPVPAPLPH